TPVLFMRAPEGVLFELVAGGLRDIPVAPARVETARAVQRTREHNIRALGLIGPAATESDASLLAQEQVELTRVRRLIRFRALAGAGAAIVALVLFAAAWLGLFNWLPWFLRPEAYAVWVGDRLSTPELDARIVLVVADSISETALGRPWDSTWRAEHAQLIERLSRAGAAVIAMDVVFDTPRVAAVDAQLADAVQRARARGTDVVLAAEEWAGDRLNLLPRLASLATAAGVCVGKRPLQSATILPLATRRGAAEPIPSLALAAAMGLRRQKLLGLDQAARSLLLRDAAGEVRTHGFTEVERISGLQPGCRFLREDDVSANLLIEHTDLKVLRGTQHRLRYEEVVAEQEPDLGRVRGRAALVGRLFAGDRFRIWRGPLSVERRYGVELHADALNTVLRDVVIRPAGNAIQFAATLLLAVAGAAIAGLALGDWPRRAALVVVAGLWLTVCAYVYAEDRILLIALIQLAALVSAHAIARRTKRWVFP
ncbi:MAG TPA: CHASE2 domain-containing protein, partial [Gemmatimonadales bacterium]|nr:CHASE2 domain-containing protein [Gemmatimonadales bacterium]